MTAPYIRHPYERVRTPADIPAESEAIQSAKDACDINAIVRRYETTGEMPVLRPQDPLYGDFSDTLDYHSTLERVRAAQAEFDALPVEIRKAANYDPETLMAMVQTDEGRETLGLVGVRFEESDDDQADPPSPKPANPAQDLPPAEPDASPNGDA